MSAPEQWFVLPGNLIVDRANTGQTASCVGFATAEGEGALHFAVAQEASPASATAIIKEVNFFMIGAPV